MNDAVYVGGAVDKIFGCVGPYVCKYNATTGAREGFVRVASPLYGDIRICYHAATGSLYVATWNEPNEQYYAPLTWPQRDVFPVSTGLVVGAGLGLGAIYNTQPSYNGFRWIASSGSYLYISHSGFGHTIHRVNPTLITDRDTSSQGFSGPFSFEHGAISPTQVAVPAASPFSDIGYAPIGWTVFGEWASPTITPWNIVAVEYCASNGLFYAVDGSTNLLRINDITTGAFTLLNLGVVEASADPCRIRYRASDGNLYLPNMASNTVIVWNPVSNTGVLKSGFDNPCDVVFTGSKAFAVQNAPIGLREIS